MQKMAAKICYVLRNFSVFNLAGKSLCGKRINAGERFYLLEYFLTCSAISLLSSK